ncbi:MAG: CoA transferase [Alphaproteobacteria bacterium]
MIVCQITGFGGTGPLGKLPGYDPVAQGFGGIISLNGPENGDPLRVNLTFAMS